MQTSKASAHEVVPYDLHQMWLSLLHDPWTSIAVIPTEASESARPIIGALQEITRLHALTPLKVIDAHGVSVADATGLAEDLKAAVSAGIRVVVGVDSLMASLSGYPLVWAAETAMLVVPLGDASLGSVGGTIELVGRSRIMGCVAVHPRR